MTTWQMSPYYIYRLKDGSYVTSYNVPASESATKREQWKRGDWVELLRVPYTVEGTTVRCEYPKAEVLPAGEALLGKDITTKLSVKLLAIEQDGQALNDPDSTAPMILDK